MKPESIGYVVAGMLFGILLGWVLAVQQAGVGTTAPPAPAAAAAATPAAQAGDAQRPPPLNEARVQELTKTVAGDPRNVGATTELANLYFDAQRFSEAATWYERSLKLAPDDPDVSTDLGVSYFYTDRADLALSQFDRSLKINPSHVKTLFNKGIVLAFGKEDIKGATAAWQRVLELAPDTPEGQAAKRALEGIATGPHAGGAATSTNQ